MMQVVVNRKASGKYGSSYTEILSRPSQFEGVEKKGVAGFKKIQTLQDASKWSGQSEATLLGIIKNIQNPSLQSSSAQYVGGAFEFRAAPQYYLSNGLVPGQMGPDGRFYGSGWRGGPGDNQFLKDPIRDKSRINPAGPASFNNLPKPIQQSTSSPVKAISAGTMKLIPQTGAGGIIQGGSGSKGETQYATHFHIDAKTSNPTTEQLANIREVSFQAVKAMLARGSTVWFGNLNQYASKNDSTLRNQIAAEQRAHDARSSAAVDIQETNPNVKRTFPSQAGSATKFPFAVGQVYSRGGYGRESEIIGSNGITVSHGAAGSTASQISPSTLVASPANPSTPAPPPAQISPTFTQQNQQQVAQQITPERRGQDVVAIIPQQQAAGSPQSAAPASSAGGGSSAPSMFDVLNTFMKQKLLLDLAYV
jgi:hypothetical protein